jgi:hypothetical protein
MSCGTKNQNPDHLIFECELLNKERDSLTSTVLKTNVWSISKIKLIRKHFKISAEFTNELSFGKLHELLNPLNHVD